jgi:hypothetical protein
MTDKPLKAGDKIQIEVSDRPGVWLEATVLMVTKFGHPGFVTVDEGIPFPFGIFGDKQGICVMSKTDGTFYDLHTPRRTIKIQAAASPQSS